MKVRGGGGRGRNESKLNQEAIVCLRDEPHRQ
jgi:hypothetical protein